jgi:hypothetical protein
MHAITPVLHAHVAKPKTAAVSGRAKLNASKIAAFVDVVPRARLRDRETGGVAGDSICGQSPAASGGAKSGISNGLRAFEGAFGAVPGRISKFGAKDTRMDLS